MVFIFDYDGLEYLILIAMGHFHRTRLFDLILIVIKVILILGSQ